MRFRLVPRPGPAAVVTKSRMLAWVLLGMCAVQLVEMFFGHWPARWEQAVWVCVAAAMTWTWRETAKAWVRLYDVVGRWEQMYGQQETRMREQYVWFGDLSGFQVQADEDGDGWLTHRCGWEAKLAQLSAGQYLGNLMPLVMEHREGGCLPRR